MSDQRPMPSQPLAIQFPFPQMQLPQFVFNTYALSYSASEMTAIVGFSERQFAQLIMPFAVAKSFAESILESIKSYEQSTGTEVLSVEDITSRMGS